jgi:DNA polymerase-3 subunit gamma/tau
MLSITDRILSHNNYAPELKSDVVLEVLGLGDQNKIIDFFETILKGDAGDAISKLAKFYENSTDLVGLITDLQKIVHNVILTKTTNYQGVSFSKQAIQKIKDLAEKTSLVDLIRIWQMLLKGNVEIAGTSSQKMVMEILLVRMCHLVDIPNLEKLILSQESNNKSMDEGKAEHKDKNLAENIKSDQDPASGLVGEIMRNFSGSKVVE